jgi:murein DD-endopeptidase MepM/ murein hydrolase activator NlpD
VVDAVKSPFIQRKSLPVVAAAPIAAGAARQAASPLLAPVAVAPLRAKPVEQAAVPTPRNVDPVNTGTVRRIESVAPAPVAAAAPQQGEGWTKAGGTYVSAREGETVYNLSKRYGVPANAIIEANGLASATSLQAGQQVLIPTYIYSRTAPVSAPDSNPKTANARADSGSKFDVPAGQVPIPQSPEDRRNLAVLPAEAGLREKQVVAVTATPKPKAQAPNAGTGTYVVQSGDTLWGISKKTGVSVTALKSANGLSDGNIRIGQQLALDASGAVAAPSGVDPIVTGGTKRSASVDRVETERKTGPSTIKLPEYTPPSLTEKTIKQSETEVATAAPDATGISKMRWPVRGKVVTGYGARIGSRSNDGIDIAVPQGTPVKAAENGVVIYAGDGLKELGKTVLVRHSDGVVTVYGHVSSINVQRGQTIKRGDTLAASGMSGQAETPKLHFEVRKNSRPVNPAGFLE